MRILMALTQCKMHPWRLPLLPTSTHYMQVLILSLIPTMLALCSRPSLRLDHCQRLISMSTCRDPMSSYATLASVLDSVNKNHRPKSLSLQYVVFFCDYLN